MSDNFRFDISAGGSLSDALTIAFSQHKTVVGYRNDIRVDDVDRLIFYWASSDKMIPFPSILGKSTVEELIMAWLRNTDPGTGPHIDGDVELGFRVYNEAWGHIDGDWEAFFAVEPCWMMYGK